MGPTGLLKLSFFTFGFTILVGCASDRYNRYPGPGKGPLSSTVSNVSDKSAVSDRYPWETWSFGKDLQGQSITHPILLQTEELRKKGELAKALEEISRTNLKLLTPQEREVYTLRRASLELALGQGVKALNTLSDFFTSTGKSVSDVDARFALIFAYAYGHRNDVDQSLAWFSRTYQSSNRSVPLSSSARQGVRALLRSLSQESFTKLNQTWAKDSFVHEAIGEERSFRARPAYTAPTATAVNRFWERQVDEMPGPAPSGEVKLVPVGVLLPLSGQFQALGNHIKNGMDLALESVNLGNINVVLNYRDTAADTARAVASAQELIGVTKASVIVGPLLFEEAQEVKGVARQHRTPLIAFSKSERFETGDGIFRLGPTASSQVESLLNAAQQLNISSYAVIFPDEPGGREFYDIFKAKLHERQLELAFEMSYPKDDQQVLAALAEEIEKFNNVQAVFIPDNIINTSRFLAALSANARGRIQPLGTALWDNQAELSRSSAVFNGAIYVSPFFSQSKDPTVSQFNQTYSARYRQPADFLAAQGFDAIVLAASAIKEQQAHTLGWQDALQSIGKYAGLTGEIELMPHGELKREFKVVRFNDGVVTEINTKGTSEGISREVPQPLGAKFDG